MFGAGLYDKGANVIGIIGMSRPQGWGGGGVEIFWAFFSMCYKPTQVIRLISVVSGGVQAARAPPPLKTKCVIVPPISDQKLLRQSP